MDNNIATVLTKSQRLILGSLILILVDVIWVSSSELTKFIYMNETFEKPFFCTYIKTSMFILYLFGFLFWPPWKDACSRTTDYIFLEMDNDEENYFTETNSTLSNPIYIPVKTPDRENVDKSSGTESDDSTIRSVRFNKLAEVRHMSESDATEALLARLSYQASLRAGEMAKRAASKLPIVRIAKISLIFCLLWFLANYTFQLALSETQAGMVNVLTSTSSLFTLILAALFPSNPADRFTLSKMIAVFFSIIGIIMVSFADLSIETPMPSGAVLSLFSALFYSVYLVFLRRKVDYEDKIDIPLFFGFVGLFNLILLWPLFFFLHISKVEVFEWPTKEQMMLLLLNGLLGTVISEALWLWGCFLTSSLTATVSVGLTVPMTAAADLLLKGVAYPALFYAGVVPTLAAFIAVVALSRRDGHDPILEIFGRICRKSTVQRFRFNESPSEQTEALIGINSEHEA